jgi:transitional endoplasmic reticulum ATPase
MREASQAVIRPLPGGSAKSGVVTLGNPEFHAGDFVLLQNGERQILGRVAWHFVSSRPARDEVWIDEWQREDLGASIGDRVSVTRLPAERVPVLREFDLLVSGALGEMNSSPRLAGFMSQRKFPVYHGFRFEVTPPGSDQTVRCRVHCGRNRGQESPYGICAAETVVHLSQAGEDQDSPESCLSYEDIGGLDREIETVREIVELPIRMRRSIKSLGISPPHGVIFWGPPGTGKTRLARAVGNRAGVPVLPLSPSALLSLHPSEAEKLLNSVFDEAERAPEGSIILIDDLDVIAGKRGEGGSIAANGLVTALLTRLDGLKSRLNVVVIGTTNRLDAIDDAVRRHGRFSREIHIGAPDEQGRLQILQIHMRPMPLAGHAEQQREQVLGEIARQTRGFVGADLMELCREAGLNALRRMHPLGMLDRGDVAAQGPAEITREDFERALRLVKPSAMKEVLLSIPDVTFGNIAGLDVVIAEIRNRVLAPMAHAAVFQAMGLHSEKGLLLYGPPGTGKTMLAKAIANECRTAFLAVQGPELLTKWFGESEEGVRRVFARARQLAPSVLFFDEIEALIPARGRHAGDAGASDRVVNQFLAELDGVVELHGVTVIGATNRPELLDRAALRPGRLGTHIFVPLPNQTARRAILRLYLKDNLSAGVLEQLVTETDGLSGADLAAICRDATLIALCEVEYARAVPVTEAHLQASLRQHLARRQPWA